MLAHAAYYDSGRDGDSWETAYIINTAEDMITLKDRVNSDEEPSGKYYVLAADIDLTSEIGWEGIGDYDSFRGHFDGQNHTVMMDSQNNTVYAGLFHTVASGSNNVAIRNLNVTGTIKGNCAGTIVHYLNSGIVENCSFSGSITPSSTSSSFGAGGIVAHLEGGTVSNCRVSGSISGIAYAGGIAGEVSSGNIQNCTVAEGTTITAQQVGGIAGKIPSNFSGNISGNSWPRSMYPESGNDYPPQVLHEWNGHKYQIHTESLTWEQAKARCESLGGHLATITSQAEQNAITSLLTNSQGNYWVGAYADESGWWKWVTGEPFEKQYENYAQGQPDGAGTYLQVNASGEWDDVSDRQQGFICEIDDKPEEVRTAPPASEFSEWLANPELYSKGDGALPSPIDTSHLRNNPPRVTASSVFMAADSESLPSSYDARAAIGLPEARDQGGYGTCWSFAALGAMEANYREQNLTSLGESPDLSELHLAWFTYKTLHSNDVRSAEYILNRGGSPTDAESFLSMGTSPVREEDMPYSQASNIEAFVAGKTFTRTSVKLHETKNIGPIDSQNMDEVKSYIMKHGAVYFHYSNDDRGYDSTHSSFFYASAGEKHAALLVGWDDDYPAANFKNTPSINGAWLVRNSWGKDWGDNGYFWMSYEQGEVTNTDNGYVFIVSEDIPDNTEEKKLHNEGGEKVNITPQWSANIFMAERNENIIRITFNTTDNNAEYQIYINNLGKDKPDYPGSVIEPVLSGTMPNAGYHTLQLSSPIELYAGDYYSVIVKMTTQYDYPTAAEGTIDGYFTASVNEGESYFASGDAVPSVWVDGKSVGDGGYNATVRVVTVARQSDEVKPVITTTSLPVGSADVRYEYQLDAEGSEKIEWRSGRLPEGFALSREGVLSGQSEAAVNEAVKFTAFNNVGSAEKTLRLRIETSVERPDDPKPDTPTEPLQRSEGGCNSGLLGMLGVLVMMLLRKVR